MSEELEVNELDQLREALHAANRKLAALNAGVAPEMVDDAVILAAASGEDDFDGAMAGVLSRHPDWRQRGKFQLGIDPDRSAARIPDADNGVNAKRWNRFK